MTDDKQREDPPAGGGAWKEQTKAVERVIDVTLSLEEPRTAGWISDEALASEQTVREHLEMLADLGVVAATTARGVTKYQPDAAYLRFKQVSQFAEQYSQQELVDKAEAWKHSIAETKEQYGVDGPDELLAKAAEEETPVDEMTKYRKAASEWETLQHELSLIQEAIERYAEFDRTVVADT